MFLKGKKKILRENSNEIKYTMTTADGGCARRRRRVKNRRDGCFGKGRPCGGRGRPFRMQNRSRLSNALTRAARDNSSRQKLYYSRTGRANVRRSAILSEYTVYNLSAPGENRTFAPSPGGRRVTRLCR